MEFFFLLSVVMSQLPFVMEDGFVLTVLERHLGNLTSSR